MHSILVLLLLVSTSIASYAGRFNPRERDVIKKEYAVSPGGTLHLDLDFGEIVIEVTDEDRVLIALEREARADSKEMEREMLQHHEYTFDKRADDVFVRSRLSQDRGIWRLRKRHRVKIKLTVRVPSDYNVTFKNGAGNVRMTSVNGRVSGRTGAGNIVLKDVKAAVDITSGAGNIDASGAITEAEVSTGAGNIELRGLRGSIKVATGAGNIDAEITHQPDGYSRLKSGAGNVVVALADDISVHVTARATIGAARCDFPLEVSKKFLSNSFAGDINGGGVELNIESGVGNVSLRRRK